MSYEQSLLPLGTPPNGSGSSTGYPMGPSSTTSTGYPHHGTTSAYDLLGGIAPLGTPDPVMSGNNPYTPNNTSHGLSSAYNAVGSGYSSPSAAAPSYPSPSYGGAPTQRPFNPMDQYVEAEKQRRKEASSNPYAVANVNAAYPASSAYAGVAGNKPYATTSSAASATKPSLSSSSGSGGSAGGDSSNDPHYFKSSEYLHSLGMTDEDIIKARMEHVDPEPDMCMSNEELRDYAGVSIWAYFRYLKFVCILIGVLFVLGLINYVAFADKRPPAFKSAPAAPGSKVTRAWYSDFFITGYTGSQKGAWMGTTIVALISIVAGWFLYRQVWIGCFKFEDRTLTLAEAEDVVTQDTFEDTIIRYHKETCTIDVAAHYRSATEVTARRFISFLVFCGFIAVQFFTSVAITKSEDGNANIGGSFAIAILAAVLNKAFVMLCRQLTEFEKYEKFGHADRSLVFKLVCFKIANVMAVFGAKSYGSTQCVYDVIGEQFLTLLLVEAFFTTPSNIAISALMTKNKDMIAKFTGSILGDAKNIARFELPVEYLGAAYKFMVSALAMIVFPLSSVLAFVAFFVEFWAARYRLIKLCGKPTRSDSNHRNVTVIIMFLVFLSVVFCPFAGAMFIMSGDSMTKSNTTILCNNFPVGEPLPGSPAFTTAAPAPPTPPPKLT